MEHRSRLLRYTGLGFLLAVLAAGPFFRGLFFWTELLAALALVSLGFTLWLTGRRLGNLPAGLPGGVAGAALLALLAAYLLQFAWAVFPRGNLDWVLRVAVGWMAYVMVRQESGPGLRRWLGWLFVLSAAGVAVAGFLEYTGYFARNPELIAALNIVNLGDRMYTPLQYPNTAAAYLLAAVFAGTGLALEERRTWKLSLSAGLISLLSLAVFFTLSRGAVVVLPFGLLALFIGLDRSKRWPALLLLGAAWLPVLAVVRFIGPAAAAKQVGLAFEWVGAAVAGSAALGLLLAFFLRRRLRTQVAAILLALVAGSGLLMAFKPNSSLIPPQAARLLDINFKTTNVIYRLTLFDDALAMIKDQPLGRGGWGWERTYKEYQETYYIGRETHSHYLQTGVEAGLPGLAALVAAVLAALWVAWQNRTGEPLGWSLSAGAVLIAGHSLIEFNLSYFVVWLLFWVLFAAASPPLPTLRFASPALWTGSAGAVGVTGLSLLLLAGSWQLDQAERLKQANRPEEATAAARRAASFDPWNSAPLVLIGDRTSLERAIRLDPHLSDAHWELSLLLEHSGEYDGALKEAQATVATVPLHSLYLNRLASISGKLMVDGLDKGDTARARELAAELVQMGADVKEYQGRKGPWMQAKPSMDPEFRLRYGQALFLTGAEQEAEGHLKEAAKVGLLNSEADVWLYALYERRGDLKELKPLEGKPWVRFRGTNPVYKAIRSW